MYSTGLPPQTCLAGISLPGGTTEFGTITAPLSTLDPSSMTELAPIKQSSSIIQL
jgi:hypothetical protein